MKRLNGIRLSHRKHAESKKTEQIPLPKTVRIPMQMHMGAPCKPLVKQGDQVTVGQLIGEMQHNFSAPIHASVSGTVKSVAQYQTGSGAPVPCIEIEPDGQQTLCPDCKPPVIETKEDLIAAVRASGCVGLGGAGFPTHIKLNTERKIDLLILNGAECEPFLTTDCRQMVEAPQEIIGGICLLMKLLHIKETRIGIEANKPAAIRQLSDACEEFMDVSVVPLPPVYPQGAEKVLIYHTCGRVVPEGKIPADVGVIVLNVSTSAFLYRYSQNGIPLTERVVTVDGDAVRKPCNLRVPIGTPLRDLLEYAECDMDAVKQLYCGGPMMGLSLYSPDMPVTKQQNGLLALKSAKTVKSSACIRCGRCMRACPMKLMPVELERAYRTKNIAALESHHLRLCINCGCCSYVCPAKRPLAESHQLAKLMLPKV